MTDTVPVAVVSIETGIDIAVLAARLGDAVHVDQAGLRVITSEQAKTFLDAHHAARGAAREQAQRQAERLAVPNVARARVRALTAAQAAADPGSMSAYAAMIATDADNPLERAGRHMDEMLSGAMQVHKVQRED
jgi:hypothetical protein